MAAVTTLMLRVVGEDKSGSKALKGVGDEAQKTTSRMKDFAKGAGKALAIGTFAGAAVGVKVMADLAKGAAEDQKSAELLANSLRNTANATDAQVAATEDWITKQGIALGVADDQLRPALTQLAAATGDVGEAQKLTSLAMDVAAGTGKSLESVTLAIAKAQNGSIGGLSRLGIKTKDAAGETLSAEAAIKSLSKTFEGQASTSANTLEGKMGRLRLMISEAGETIGYKLIPIITKMADWFLNKGLPAMEKFGGWLSNVMPPIIANVKQVIAGFVSAAKSLWDRFGSQVIAMAKNFRNIFRGIIEFIRGFFKIVRGIFTGDWRMIWAGVKGIFKGAIKVLFGTLRNFGEVIKAIFKTIGSAIRGLVVAMWGAVRDLFRSGLGNILDALRSAPGAIIGLGSKFLNAGKSIMGKLFDGLKSAVTGVGGFMGNIAETVLNGIIGIMNKPLQAINDALPDKIGLPGVPDINLPDNPIPMIPTVALAKGGIITRPTFALMGEDGPEAVVPLSRKNNPRGYGLGGGGDTFVLSMPNGGFIGDEAKLARELEKLLARHNRRLGRVVVA